MRPAHLMQWMMARVVINAVVLALAGVLAGGGLVVAMLVKGDPTPGLADRDGRATPAPAGAPEGPWGATPGRSVWRGGGAGGTERESPRRGGGASGGDVAIDPVALDGDDVTVTLAGITAYRDGMMLHVSVAADPGASVEAGELAQDRLAVGVAHPDGRVVRTVDDLVAGRGGDGPPEEPVLTLPGYGYGERSWRYDLWVAPRPGSGGGPVALIVEWPGHGLDARVELDAAAITAAAAGRPPRTRP